MASRALFPLALLAGTGVVSWFVYKKQKAPVSVALKPVTQAALQQAAATESGQHDFARQVQNIRTDATAAKAAGSISQAEYDARMKAAQEADRQISQVLAQQAADEASRRATADAAARASAAAAAAAAAAARH